MKTRKRPKFVSGVNATPGWFQAAAGIRRRAAAMRAGVSAAMASSPAVVGRRIQEAIQEARLFNVIVVAPGVCVAKVGTS